MAQSVEQLIRNQQVVGSIPISSPRQQPSKNGFVMQFFEGFALPKKLLDMVLTLVFIIAEQITKSISRVLRRSRTAVFVYCRPASLCG